jgi:hypothetical protein
MIKNDVNINELIKEDYKVPESVFDTKRTKTSHFMLNTIFPNNSIISTEYFVNAFLDDEKFDHDVVRPIFILFKTSLKDNKWTMLSQKIKTKAEFVLEYFCGIQDGKHLIMMVFSVPDKFAKEYELFKIGKYSKFSENYKKLFPQYLTNDRAQSPESKIWQALYKSDALRKELENYFTVTPNGSNPTRFAPEDELWGIIEPKYEVYRYGNNE